MRGIKADHVRTGTQVPLPESAPAVPLLSRVKTMVKSADSNGSLHEVIAVLCRVQYLIKESWPGNVDSGPANDRAFMCHHCPSDARIIPGWLSALSAVACLVTGCRWYFGRRRDNSGTPRRSVTFCGRGELAEVTECLFTLLCRQMLRDLDIWRRDSERLRLKTAATRNCTDKWRSGWIASIWSALLEHASRTGEKNTPGARQDCDCCHTWSQSLSGNAAVIRETEPHSCLFPAGNRHTHI
ncbi:hypothetical protein HX362_003227 [Salmonella enterica]|nr:hypothetical protein [Salmonella enterica]